MTNNKRGGYREGSGSKPHPPAEVASVRIVANVTPAEAAEWQRRGRTAWLRADLRGETSSAILANHVNKDVKIKFGVLHLPYGWALECADEDRARDTFNHSLQIDGEMAVLIINGEAVDYREP